MSCCPENPTIRIRTASGVIDLPVIDGVITIPNFIGETTFAAVEGNGISIISGGTAGHAPTISIDTNDSSPIPITFDGDGQMSVGPAPASPTWTSPNTTAQGGIRVVNGGTLGHNPTFAISIGAGQPLQIQDGKLVFTGDLSGFDCSALAGCSIGSLGDVDTTTTPEIGDILTWDGNAWVPATPAATADCGFTAPNGATADKAGTFFFACATIDIDGSDIETEAPAAGFVEGWTQTVVNGVSGTETWRIREDAGTGALQWHQID